jgi:hypothetical protein
MEKPSIRAVKISFYDSIVGSLKVEIAGVISVAVCL